MSIKLKDTIYDFISNSDKLDGYNASDFSLVHDHNYISSTTKQSPNKVLAGPSSGSTTSAPSFRSLVAADIPNLSISKITNLQSTLDGKSGTGHNHDSAYLKLIGGTLTGKLGITDSNNGASITLDNISGTSGNPCYIYYKVSGATKASTGYFNNFAYLCNEVATGYPRIGISDTGNPEYWDAASDANKYTLLHTGNWSDYCAPASHSHSYLPLSGGNMAKSGYITFTSPASSTLSDTATAFGITYGRIQAAAPISIIGDTDGTGTEYVIITSGYTVANATKANGLAVGKNELTWKNSAILTASNAASTLNGTYVNVTGDTMTGALSLPLNGINVGNNCSSDTNTYRAFRAYNSNLSTSYAGGNTIYACLGHTASAGNAAEIGFTYAGAASTSNAASMGFNAGNRLKLYYSGSSVGIAKICSSISGGTEYTLLHEGNYSTWAAPASHTHSQYAASSHTHSYLPLSGGTLTGTITSNYSGKSFVFYGTEFFDGSGNINLIDTASSTSWNVINYNAASSKVGSFCLQVLKAGGNTGVGGTASSSYKLYVHGSMYGSSLFVSSANGITVGSDGGDTATRALKSYGNTTTYINIGYAASAGNVAEIGWSYTGNASTSNKTYLGFYGGYGLHLTYNTKVATLGTATDYVTVLTSGNWSNYISVSGGNYLPLSGGTLTGSVTFANGTWNVVGDDAAIGDYNAAGMLGLKSCNNALPGIGFHNNSNTLLGTLICNAGTLTWNKTFNCATLQIGGETVTFVT